MLNSKTTTNIPRREYYEWPEALLITRIAGGSASAIALKRPEVSCLNSIISGRRTARDPQRNFVPELEVWLPEAHGEALAAEVRAESQRLPFRLPLDLEILAWAARVLA